MQLYNKLSAEERAKLIDEAGKDRLTLSFYQYFKIEDPQFFRDQLFLEWDALEVLGRTYVSYEGINAQISVPAEKFLELKAQLDGISFLKDIRLNVAVEQNNKSFLKLKIKVRDKIVAMSQARAHIVDQVGVFTPKRLNTKDLSAGEVGFVVAGIKDIQGAPVGDTFTHAKNENVEALPGFKKVQPKVYAGLFTVSSDDYEAFREALAKLTLKCGVNLLFNFFILFNLV